MNERRPCQADDAPQMHRPHLFNTPLLLPVKVLARITECINTPPMVSAFDLAYLGVHVPRYFCQRPLTLHERASTQHLLLGGEFHKLVPIGLSAIQ